jgi:hypothetical protein
MTKTFMSYRGLGITDSHIERTTVYVRILSLVFLDILGMIA